jgi:hypothetical protein
MKRKTGKMKPVEQQGALRCPGLSDEWDIVTFAKE